MSRDDVSRTGHGQRVRILRVRLALDIRPVEDAAVFGGTIDAEVLEPMSLEPGDIIRLDLSVAPEETSPETPETPPQIPPIAH